MADSINRISPATVAPDPVSATRRERDKNGRGGGAEGREREREEHGAAPAQQAEKGAQNHQRKGNRLDISA